MVLHGHASMRERLHEYGEEHEPVALPSSLLVITDRLRAAEPLTSVLLEATRGGARWLRVREPDLELFAYVALCHELIESVSQARVVWSVRPQAYAMLRTAHPELQLAVHLTSRDAAWAGPDRSLLLGRSVHDASRVIEPASQHADYVLFAPVFETACKPNTTPAGVPALGECVRRNTRPVVALGGVTVDRVAACRDAGASAVAVCGGIMETAEPAQRVCAYLEAWAQSTPPHV